LNNTTRLSVLYRYGASTIFTQDSYKLPKKIVTYMDTDLSIIKASTDLRL